MAAVLLTILKIIGIAVLSVIALVLLLVAIVLFVPFRYKADGEKSRDSNDFYANVNVSFLLHILSANVRYEEELTQSVKVFGIKVWPRNKVQKEEPVNTEPENENPPAEAGETKEDFTIDWNDEDTVPGADPDITEDTEDAEGTEGYEGLSRRIEKFIDDIISRFESLSQKYDKIKKEIRFWDKMINDTRNRNAALVLKNQLIRLLRAIRPRKVKGFIHFGFEDPATCGKVLMYLSMIYPTLPRKLVFDPSFEDTELYGNIVIKGRLYLIVVAVCAIRLYFNKDIKRMLALYKKHQNK